ncbi:1-acyl-sn-glycerol-3-phosphate acyltransferase [Alkalispirochaeta americana]|uniref:1-acyl-sn-glycerol-3-phosphate acyltransferase n=1 Tax=Alkalispirochaeta americana TaxID=159291 RepID=A0A1N6W3E1_9SPIO|nr:lysophospholipid acyltransferase family protein [Alkalispirochaeta americana]SIQ84505.1 1-acyl-sn-glycerol-3-phosphate acyltransferase [Alkalispirochaeta americana]
MATILLLVLVFARLLWWDLGDKIRICLSWNLARRHIDRHVSERARKLFSLARFTLGLKMDLDFDDSRLPDQMILLANHQSVMDIVIIMAAFRHHSVKFVAKGELRRWCPTVSRVLRIQRHALIPRKGDYSLAMKEIDRMAGSLRGRECPVIFPEGTRSRDGNLLPFQSGAVRRIHNRAPLPLVALALEGGGRFSRVQDVLTMPRGHRYRITVAKVFPPAQGKREILAQVEESRHAIDQILRNWRSQD